MKKTILILLATTLMFSSCYRRIGDLTILANRNVNLKSDYVLLKRNVEGKCKSKKQDALEIAVDRAVESADGEYLMNVKVFVKKNGTKIKVIGDVYGVKSDFETQNF